MKRRRLTTELITESAAQYKTRSEWQNGDSSAYMHAWLHRKLDHYCKHMIPTVKWTPEMIQQSADKYMSRSEWQRNNQTAYMAAYNVDELDRYCKHMYVRKIKWTDSALQIEALKYKTKSEWQSNHNSSYNTALSSPNYAAICAHMTEKYTYWTHAMIMDEALKYTCRSAWQAGSQNSYSAARRINKNIDKYCQHMPKQNGKFKWTPKMIQQSANKYTIRSEWRVFCKNAYNAASRAGILNHVCLHMNAVNEVNSPTT